MTTKARAAASEPTLPQPDDVRAVYQQLCESYRAIDDSRLKLLGLLPLATGAGILVLSGRADEGMDRSLSLAVGLFGLMATLGLYSYELHGMKKCGALIDAGRLIERSIGINGQFERRPQEVAGFIDEPFSASIIYPASLAGWAYFAFRWLGQPWVAVVPACFFVGGFVLSIWLIRRIEYDMGRRMQYGKEPLLFRRIPGSIARPKVKPKRGMRRRRLPSTAIQYRR
jgi:hypothetical protein